jgi:hypothetical protein
MQDLLHSNFVAVAETEDEPAGVLANERSQQGLPHGLLLQMSIRPLLLCPGKV